MSNLKRRRKHNFMARIRRLVHGRVRHWEERTEEHGNN